MYRQIIKDFLQKFFAIFRFTINNNDFQNLKKSNSVKFVLRQMLNQITQQDDWHILGKIPFLEIRQFHHN